MTWKNHVPMDEREGLIEDSDDGSAVFLSSYAGGGAEGGAWSSLTLMRVLADGTHEIRTFTAKSDWQRWPADQSA